MGEIHTKLGKLLLIERERQGIDLTDLAEELKISQVNLEAIEQGDVGALPTELYFNLFAKSYAERLGIDYGRTVDAIKQDVGEASETPETSPRKSDKKQKAESVKPKTEEDEDEVVAAESRLGKRLLWGAGVVVVLFLGFLAVSAIFYGKTGLEGLAPGGSSTESSTTTAADERSAELAGYDWNVPSYDTAGKIQLMLTSRDESWATVLADGDTVVYRNLMPGREYRVEAKYRFLVSIGIPSRVRVLLNGQEVSLVNPESRRISRVEINQVNLGSFLDGTYYGIEEQSVTATTPVRSSTSTPESSTNQIDRQSLGNDAQPSGGDST
jgi:transcriptional regulator with XRE-family HTH domain